MSFKTFKKAHHNSIKSIKYVPTFDKLVSGGKDKKVKVWDINKKNDNSSCHSLNYAFNDRFEKGIEIYVITG